MSAKRKSRDSVEVDKVILKRRALTLIQKVAILDRLAHGEGSTSVARSYGLSEGTVRSIKKCEDKIRSSVAAGAPHNAKMTFYARDAVLQRMEKVLIEWIDDQNLKGVPVDGTIIRKEAKRLYDQFKVEDESKEESKPDKPTTFLASKGWYEKFKKRVSLYNSLPEEPAYEYLDQFNQDHNMQGEEANLFCDDFHASIAKTEDCDVSILDHDEAKKFASQLMKIIDLKKYSPEQVFNATELGLFWKRMPKNTFLCEEEKNAPGSKFSIDKLNLVLCGNASGDCTVKPMAVYRSPNPRSLKGKNKHQLPVFWKSNPSASVTEKEFVDWFHNCFIHEVKIYLASKNIPFRVLLILDTLPCHPFTLQNEDPNVKVVFLPENTAPLLQPFDQGLVDMFRAHYTRRIFGRIVEAKTIDPYVSVSELWWDYTVADCLKVIKETVQELRPSMVNACWNKLWSDAVSDPGDIPAVHHVVEKIVQLGHAVGGDGFEDLEAADVEGLLESHRDEPSEEESNELAAASDEECEERERLKNQLTLESLEKSFKLARELQDILFDVDPFMERGFESKKAIEDALAPYKEMYNDLQYSKSLLINNAIPKPKPKRAGKRLAVKSSI